MNRKHQQIFITGICKYFIYLKIVLHVIMYYGREVMKGKLNFKKYFIFLYRAFLFLRTVRHNKIVKTGNKYKLHLYIPAYPTRAFFYTLEKLIRKEPGPVTVVLSMTRACSYHCPHCYQRKDAGKDLDIELLLKVSKSMQDAGVSMFDIEGGEPLLQFDRLIQLMHSLDDRSELWINTTGYNLTEEKVKKLIEAGLAGVMVSLHEPEPEKYDSFTGVKGSYHIASRALKLFHQYGIYTAINCCPSSEIVVSGDLERLMDIAKEHQCSYVQMIHGKSAGSWLGKKDEFNESELLISKLQNYHLQYNTGGRFKKYPSLSAQVFEESEDLFGCTAGGVDRFYLGADGELQPCEFLNISFGNVKNEDFMRLFRRMRSFFRKPGCDWLCCTQALFIDEIIKKHKLSRTPIPWEITKTFIETWHKGKETGLYKNLGIYR